MKIRCILMAGLCACLFGCATTKKTAVSPPEPPPPEPDPTELATTHYEKGMDLLHMGEIDQAKIEFDRSLSHLLSTDEKSIEQDSLLTEVCRARLLADRSKITKWRLFTLLDGEFVFNKDVQRWIEHYTMKDREYIEKALWRSHRYLPQIHQIFLEEDLPLELSYLPIIESGFHPFAHSRAGAVGLWQFMPSTGKRFNLRINEWVDERRDPEKSTRAAAEFLKLLYDRHGSWSLALAAYNWGPRRVERSVNLTGNNDYWGLLLPKETAEFVPKFLATLLIALDPEVYGFDGVYTDHEEIDTFIVKGCVNLGVVATASGTELSLLRDLNPELREDFTPPTDASYSIRIPLAAKDTFKENFYALSENERFLTQKQVEKLKRKRWITYRIRRGDTLSQISRKFGVSVSQLRKWNSKARRKYIRAGDRLRIYIH